jgi:adenosylhomocysteine nucleosidase
MRILLVAADPMEFSGMLSLATDHGPVPSPRNGPIPQFWRCASLGHHEALLVANGAGRERAAAAVDRAAAEWGAEAVVSTGFCGALDQRLEIASVVVATSIDDGEFRYSALPAVGPFETFAGSVQSIDRVARTAEEKALLRESGSCAVEMEAAGVAARAFQLGLPFYCVRAVTDLAYESLANDFNSALRPDGHFDTMSILLGALRDPAVRLPELLRLRSRSIRAARRLGEFFADCRL